MKYIKNIIKNNISSQFRFNGNNLKNYDIEFNNNITEHLQLSKINNYFNL